MDISQAASDEIAFSMRVLGHLTRGQGGANLAVSPLSIHAALVLLGAGARGATLDQIVAVLGPAGGHAHAALASHVALRVFADGDGFGGPTLRFANGVCIDDALRHSADYARVLSEHYRAVSSSEPFKSTPEEARGRINQWIANATAGRIRDLLPPGSVRPDTAAVLANALYFKGAWSRKFDTASTLQDNFYLPMNGGHVLVPFMSSTRKQHIVTRPGYKVLRLPYAGGGPQVAFAMYIYLPDGLDGLPSMLDRLSSDPRLLETSSTMMGEVPVRQFKVPKFTMSCKVMASAMLRVMGLSLPFDPPPRRLRRDDDGAADRTDPRVGGLPRVLRRGERGRDRGRCGHRRRDELRLRGSGGAAGGLRRRPPVHVRDQGGIQRRGGFRRASDQPLGRLELKLNEETHTK